MTEARQNLFCSRNLRSYVLPLDTDEVILASQIEPQQTVLAIAEYSEHRFPDQRILN